jgi:hypothetical protein
MGKKQSVRKEEEAKSNQEDSTLIIISPFGIAIVPTGITFSEGPCNNPNCVPCRYRRQHTGNA